MSLKGDQKAGSPPPYGDDRQQASNVEAPPSEPPPAYEPADSEATQPATDVKVRPQEDTATNPREHDLGFSNQAGPSSSAAHVSSSAASSSSMNPLSLVQSYKDKRRAKQAAKKVDFYEKMYGFVPKNAMTEAEWKDARARAPKVKKPITPGGRPYFGSL